MGTEKFTEPLEKLEIKDWKAHFEYAEVQLKRWAHLMERISEAESVLKDTPSIICPYPLYRWAMESTKLSPLYEHKDQWKRWVHECWFLPMVQEIRDLLPSDYQSEHRGTVLVVWNSNTPADKLGILLINRRVKWIEIGDKIRQAKIDELNKELQIARGNLERYLEMEYETSLFKLKKSDQEQLKKKTEKELVDIKEEIQQIHREMLVHSSKEFQQRAKTFPLVMGLLKPYGFRGESN